MQLESSYQAKKTVGHRILLFFTILCFPCLADAQGFELSATPPTVYEAGQINNAENPCINTLQYALLEKECQENAKKFNIAETNNRSIHSVYLTWPLRPAIGLQDCSYYHISAYVDHNAAVGTIRDFNCGTKTYDGHTGTDISTWPYNFHKMDNNLVEVVAAAAGTIIGKHDGEFDRNCSSNNLTANYIIIQHADGSYALYWHMKKNAVTTKAIGQTVIAGEYLGVVGSSGSASGPHLHFEIWTGLNNTTRIDPYYASSNCSTLNFSSWWASQKPHKETAVMKASVNTTDNITPGCPTTETPNEGSLYQIPYQGAGLAPGYARFYAFLRDQISGLVADLSVLNPDGSIYLSWSYTSVLTNNVNQLGWSKLLPTIPGTYTFKATYNGISCSYTFKVYNCSTGQISIPENDLNLSKIIKGIQTFNTQTIVANNSISNLNTSVTYTAEKSIMLLPNFKADNNAVFVAKIDGCP